MEKVLVIFQSIILYPLSVVPCIPKTQMQCVNKNAGKNLWKNQYRNPSFNIAVCPIFTGLFWALHTNY